MRGDLDKTYEYVNNTFSDYIYIYIIGTLIQCNSGGIGYWMYNSANNIMK